MQVLNKFNKYSFEPHNEIDVFTKYSVKVPSDLIVQLYDSY